MLGPGGSLVGGGRRRLGGPVVKIKRFTPDRSATVGAFEARVGRRSGRQQCADCVEEPLSPRKRIAVATTTRADDLSPSPHEARRLNFAFLKPRRRLGLALGKWRALLKRKRSISCGKPQRRFGKEFAAEAVRLVEVSGRTQREIALDLGVGLSTLRRWLDKRREDKIEQRQAARTAGGPGG